MSNYLHTKVREIENPDLRTVLEELCHCVRWDLARHESGTVFYLLAAIFLEHPQGVTLDHLPVTGLLGTKVRKIKSSGVQDFCAELIRLKHTHVEVFDKKPLLALITECFPKQTPVRETKELSDHERLTRLIIQRRRNGDL